VHRAWDYLLWALLLMVAGATALSIAALVAADPSVPWTESAVAPMGLVLVGCVVVGLSISLERSERGRSVWLASLVRVAIFGGVTAAVLAAAVGASRTSPLVYVALLGGSIAACGLQRLLLDRLPLPQFWARALRRLANIAGLIGVQFPIALVVCLGVATWIVSMVARGGPPLADEGALPLAELLVRVAAGVWSLVTLPLAMVVVAARVFGRRTTGRAVPGELRVEVACPRCGDRTLRPFGRSSGCRACGLEVRPGAPEMACGCGTTLVGVPGDRCPECDAAIRTRWGGPAVSLVPRERPREAPASGRLWARGAWICFALLPFLLLWGPTLIEAAQREIPRLDRVATEGILVCAVWGMLLVAVHAVRLRRGRWLAWAVLALGGAAVLTSSAAAQALLPRPLGGEVALLAWSLVLLGTAALAVLREPSRGASERRARGVVLLSLGLMAVLLGVGRLGRMAEGPGTVRVGAGDVGQSGGQSTLENVDVVEVVESVLKEWPEVVQLETGFSRPVAAMALFALGTGLALVIVRRLVRRRQLRPEFFGLSRDSAVAIACPRCTARLRVPLAHARVRCEGCDLSIHVGLREGARIQSAAAKAAAGGAAPAAQFTTSAGEKVEGPVNTPASALREARTG